MPDTRYKLSDAGNYDKVLASAKPGSKEKPPYLGTEDPSFLMDLIKAMYGMQAYTPFANNYREAYPPGYQPPPRPGMPMPTPGPTMTPPPPNVITGGIEDIETREERLKRLQGEYGI